MSKNYEAGSFLMLSIKYSLQGVQFGLFDRLLCELKGLSDQMIDFDLDLVVVLSQTFHFLFAVELFQLSLLLRRLFSLLLSQGQLLFQSLQLDVLAHNRLLPQLNSLALCLKLLNKEVNLIQLVLKMSVSLNEFASSFEQKQKEASLLLLVPLCGLFVIYMIVFPIFSGELGKIDHVVADHQRQQFLAVLLLLVGISEVPPFRVEKIELFLLRIVTLDQAIQLSLQFASFRLQNLQLLYLILVVFACTLAIPLTFRYTVSHSFDLLRKGLLDILEKIGHSFHS